MSARLLPVYLWLLCFSVHHPHTHPLTPTDGWRGPLLTTPAPPRMSRASSAPPPLVLYVLCSLFFCPSRWYELLFLCTHTRTHVWCYDTNRYSFVVGWFSSRSRLLGKSLSLILFPQPRPLKGHHVPQSGLRSTLGPDCSYKRGEHLQCCWNKVVDELKSSFAGVQHAHVDLYQSGV